MMPRTFIEVIWVRFLIWTAILLLVALRSHAMKEPDYTHFDSWGVKECADWFPDPVPCRTGADGE